MSRPTHHSDTIEMPRQTAAPLFVGAGTVLLMAGLALGLAMSLVGAILLAVGIWLWVSQLAPGQGHIHEQRVRPDQRPRPITPRPGTVEHVLAGTPGYRLRLPTEVHPISAGLLGSLVGGILMPLPALVLGLSHGADPWISVLTGTLGAGVTSLTLHENAEVHRSWFIVWILTHFAACAVLGLAYGVLLPTMPRGRLGQILSGGLVLPLLWTGACHALLGLYDTQWDKQVDWPMFLMSQVVFGLATSLVISLGKKVRVPPAGPGPNLAPTTRRGPHA